MALKQKSSYAGAEIVVKCLQEQNVEYIFGYPGGAVIPLYDAFYKLDESNVFTHIVPTHEQHGVHAADGYARSTGKTGVVIATSGPGATNTVTGIATAFLDSVPLVVITGQVAQVLLGKDSFQEVDVVSMTKTITKHNYFVKDVQQLPFVIREAFQLAKSGRPGPVLIDIPKDVQVEEYGPFEPRKIIEEKILSNSVVKITSVEKAVKLINEAKRPVIYAGGGVIKANAAQQLLQFVEKSGIPVANSLMGLGGFPRNHSLSLGMVGMHGAKHTNTAVMKSDLILAIGSRFSDRVIGKSSEFSKEKQIIHFDIDGNEFSKNVYADVHIHGDIIKTLPLVIDRIKTNTHNEWYQEIKKWQIKHKLSKFAPTKIINKINDYYEDAIVATEVGQHQMWTAQEWKFKEPNKFITSGGLGTMGYGLGAAVGACLGNPDQDVILIAGDGSFRMNCNELATVSKHKLPLAIFIMNNKALGMVRQWQTLFFGKRYAVTDISDVVNYVKLAEAYGIKGYQATDMLSLEEILKDIKTVKGPVLVDIVISNNENVFPIVPPGASIDKIVYEK